MAKAVVGMSGGVDSAVAAYLLKEQGYEVLGLTIRTWNPEAGYSRCCEIDDAREVCRTIGIPYHILNCESAFREHVTEPFVRCYLDGKTPNPCVGCNLHVKWEKMIYWADIMQAEFVATGHYAHIIKNANGRYTVKSATHAEKDQAYMLYKLPQEYLARTLMPLGDLDKAAVREIAKKAGIHIANKGESQDICFISNGNYQDYIRANSDTSGVKEGNFVDTEGNILGTHKGIINYTVGQRKGLGIALGYPAYVKRIDVARNEVVLCDEASVFADSIRCGELNFMSIPCPDKGEKIRTNVKIRYHHKAQGATMMLTDDDTLLIEFDEPAKAPAPGQSAVFFDDDGCVMGGGIIL
ncbi:MAG: tRNA 2-thiouridine(34) synthase MnmA [Saccharofermentans sp.]|nr:tRNA 2-thiouridine(34) synthase MnmA [Saccharofermentans sp.]